MRSRAAASRGLSGSACSARSSATRAWPNAPAKAKARVLRKTADLDVADRIELFVEASAGLRSAVEAHKDYITTETLTANLTFGSPPEGASVVEDAFDGEKVKVGLIKR